MELDASVPLPQSGYISRKEALDEAFTQILDTLAETDVFSHPKSPSMFIVYAHDNDEKGIAYSQHVSQFVKWLGKIRSRTCSDKSPIPFGSTREGGSDVLHNILSNQFCLLPTIDSSDDLDDIRSVDLAVVFGSEVLKHYYHDSFTGPYIQSIEQIYDEAQKSWVQRSPLHDKIRGFVESQFARPDAGGLHHVLTELAFLKLRKRHSGSRNAGIITVALDEDLMNYLPFCDYCDLVLKLKSPDQPDLHSVFFKLLKNIFTDEQMLIDNFRDCYEQVSKTLSAEPIIMRQAVDNIIHQHISKTNRALLRLDSAAFRNHRRRIDHSPSHISGHLTAAPTYAKDLVGSIRNGIDSYWDILRRNAGATLCTRQDKLLSITDLQTNLFPRRRLYEGSSATPLAVRRDLVEAADRVATRMDGVLVSIDQTLNILGNSYLLQLTRGGMLACLRFGLKWEVYFDPIARAVASSVEYLDFLGTHTLSVFTASNNIQAIFLSIYGRLWSLCIEIYNFFVDDFGNEIHLSRDMRWETRWCPIHDAFEAVKSTMVADAAFVVELISRVFPNGSPQSSSVEYDRGRILSMIVHIDEAAERDRVKSRRQIIDWVSNLEYHATQEQLLSIRLEGTGLWLLQKKEFLNWFESNHSSILWCWGSPGVGKTVLCSLVADFISARLDQKAGNGFAVAYCTFKDPKSPDAYIFSFLRQLLSQLPHVPSGVQKRYDDLLQSPRSLNQSDIEIPGNGDDAQPSNYLNLFTYTLERFKRVHLTFDAMDECPEREKWLLPYFCNLARRYQNNPQLGVCLKIFVTSRHERDVATAFSTVAAIQIGAKNVDKDIDNFVKYELQRRFEDGSIGQLHIRLQSTIVTKLTSRADGMFLWVKYQLEDICEQFTEAGILQTLNDLPETLYTHYDRVVKIIDSQSRYVRGIAKHAIKCIVAGARRFTGPELSDSVLLWEDPEARSLAQDLDIQRIVFACHNLIATSPDGTVGFVHYSVQEYFLSEHLQSFPDQRIRDYVLDPVEAKFRLTLMCLHYLKNINQGMDKTAFFTYAIQMVARHLELSSPDRMVDPAFVALFIAAFRPGCYRSELRPTTSPVQFAAQLGLCKLVDKLLQSNKYDGMVDLEQALRFTMSGGELESYQECKQLLLGHGVHLGATSPKTPAMGLDMPSF